MNHMGNTLYICDPAGGGHHISYLVMLGRAFSRRFERIHILTGDVERLESELSRYAEKEEQSRIEIHPFSYKEKNIRLPLGRFNQLAEHVHRWYSTFRAVKKLERQTGDDADLVFLPWLDSYIRHYHNNWYVNRYLPVVLGAIIHRPWSGLYFHPRFLRRPEKYPMLYGGEEEVSTSDLFTKTGCRGIFMLDEELKAPLQKELAPVPVRWLPDIPLTLERKDDWAPLRELKNIKKGRPVILLTGVLNRYKGVTEFVDLAARCRHKNWLFVMAGQLSRGAFSDEELERITQSGLPNLHTMFEFIPREEHINELIATSDIIYCHYPEFTHSSSIQIRAGLLGTKSVVVNEYLMKTRCEKMGTCFHFSTGEEVGPSTLEVVFNRPAGPSEFLDDFTFTHFREQLLDMEWE